MKYVKDFYSTDYEEEFPCESEEKLISYVEENFDNPTVDYWYDEEEGVGHITWTEDSYTDVNYEKESSLGSDLTVKELLDMWWNSVRITGKNIDGRAVLYKQCDDGEYELDKENQPYGEQILNMIVHTDEIYDADEDGYPIVFAKIKEN